MRKKKQLRLLVILLVILAAAIAGYVLSLHYTKDDEAEESETAEEAIALYPADFDVENLASISYLKNGKTLTFIQKDDTWYYSKDLDFPVDQSSLTGMDSQLLDLAATRKVADDLDNASEYGLDEVSNKITLKDSSDNSFTIYVGNTNEGAGLTYVYTSDDKAVFTVDSEFASYFTNSLLTVMYMEELPVPDGTETFNSIDIETAAEKLSITHLSSLDYSSDYLGVMGYTAADTRNASTETYGVTDDAVESFSSALQELSPTACAAYKATKKQLKKYGLLSPACTLTLDYTQQEAVVSEDEDTEDTEEETAETEETETQYQTVSYHETIYIGVAQGETLETADTYYVTWKGTGNVYRADASSFEGVLDLEKTDLTNMMPMDFNEDELMRLEITYKGKTRTFENSILAEDEEDADEAETLDDTDSEDADDSENTDDTDSEDADDSENTDDTDSEDADDVFSEISGLLADMKAEDFYPAGGKAVSATDETITINVTLDRKKRSALTITLTPYDSDYYALMIDGEPEYLMNKTEITRFLNSLENTD